MVEPNEEPIGEVMPEADQIALRESMEGYILRRVAGLVALGEVREESKLDLISAWRNSLN